MGLLTIPGLFLIFYFKRISKFSKYNLGAVYSFVIANVIGVIILMAIFKLLLPQH
ncbi:MAG: hypothetical protein CM15mP129_02350 [Chloroflexota bacterium]|nr:MAG: hypothetical protein CM15mP129_02350 [Chloroflexota bacterium]